MTRRHDAVGQEPHYGGRAGKIQFDMRRDIVRNRIMEMKCRFGFLRI